MKILFISLAIYVTLNAILLILSNHFDFKNILRLLFFGPIIYTLRYLHGTRKKLN